MTQITTNTAVDFLNSDKSPLQDLRRAAGYRSAKEFAHKIKMPVSTYSRYERNSGGPQCGIPLSSAWVIADALDCSIDAIVGHDKGKLAKNNQILVAYEQLSPAHQLMAQEYLIYLRYLEWPLSLLDTWEETWER